MCVCGETIPETQFSTGNSENPSGKVQHGWGRLSRELDQRLLEGPGVEVSIIHAHDILEQAPAKFQIVTQATMPRLGPASDLANFACLGPPVWTFLANPC